jgi:hypothetical protein
MSDTEVVSWADEESHRTISIWTPCVPTKAQLRVSCTEATLFQGAIRAESGATRPY